MLLSNVKRERITSSPLHFPSPSAVTDAAGDVLQVLGYDPYGREIINAYIEGAPDYEEVTGTVEGSESYQARDTVTVSAALTSSADLSLAAGVKIVFEPGFSVAASGELHAAIDFNLINTAEVETRYLYTDQEREGNGLYYYGARYYDPDLGRFLAADTVLDGLNRYAYCGNNPVRYADPSGHIYDDLVAGNDGRIQTPERQTERRKILRLVREFMKEGLTPGANLNEGLLLYDSSSATMHMAFFVDGQYLYEAFDATNNVRPRRHGEHLPVEFRGYYYYPEEFPKSPEEGWLVEGYYPETVPLQGPTLSTNAERKVKEYLEDGTPTGEIKTDKGYYIHGSDGDENSDGENDIDDSTRGCIRMRNRDVRFIGERFTEINERKGSVRLHVF